MIKKIIQVFKVIPWESSSLVNLTGRWKIIEINGLKTLWVESQFFIFWTLWLLEEDIEIQETINYPIQNCEEIK